MITYGGVCWRMLTYADVCWRSLCLLPGISPGLRRFLKIDSIKVLLNWALIEPQYGLNRALIGALNWALIEP
jgi:hypothetical protein